MHLLREQDHARARPEDGHVVAQPLGDRVEQIRRREEVRHRRRLATRHDECIDPIQIVGRANLQRRRATLAHREFVSLKCSLQREDADECVHPEASNRSPAALRILLIDLVHADTGHRCTEIAADLGEDVRIAEVRRGFDDRLGAR